MDESGFIIEVAEHDGWMRIAVRGEIDLATKGQMHEALADACTKGTAGVELDLSEVTFIDSSGLLSLIDALTFCRRKDIELRIRSNLILDRLVRFTGLTEYLPLLGN